jgi:hypothetical protein
MSISVGPLTVSPVPALAGEVTVTTWSGAAVSLATAVSLDGSGNVSFAVNSAGRYAVKVTNAAFPGSSTVTYVDVVDPNDAVADPFPQYRRDVERVNVVAVGGAAQTLPDPATTRYNDITVTAALTLTFPTAKRGAAFTLRTLQSGAGSFAITWPATAKWAGGTAPTISTAAGKADYFEFRCIDGTNWWGTAAIDVR